MEKGRIIDKLLGWSRLCRNGPIDLGTHHLEKGKHKFPIKIVGANEKKAKDQYIVGWMKETLRW